jgi:hypothetical protein
MVTHVWEAPLVVIIHADGTEEKSEVERDDDDCLGSTDQEVFSWAEPRLEPVSGD